MVQIATGKVARTSEEEETDIDFDVVAAGFTGADKT